VDDPATTKQMLERYLALTRAEPSGTALLTPDVVWHVPGASQVGGDLEGPDAVLGYFRRLRDLSDGSYRVDARDGDLTLDGDRGQVWQRARAAREDVGRLDDDECVRFRVAGGQVCEAWLSVGDEAGHDRFWGYAARGALSAADQDVLAAAIRSGTAGDTASVGAIARTVLLIVAVGAILLGAYQGLRHWRPPVSLSLSSEGTTVRQINASGTGQPVSWRLDSAYVRELQVIGPESAPVEIDLPVDPGRCEQVAADLGASCSAGAVVANSPISLAWDAPEKLAMVTASGADARSSALSLSIAQPSTNASGSSATTSAAATAPTASVTAAATGAGSVDLTVSATAPADPQRWCFDFPLASTNLVIQLGNRRSGEAFADQPSPIACGTGLRLVVGATGSAHQPPALRLQGAASLRLHVDSAHADIQGATGQIHLGNAGAQVVSSATELVARAEGPRAITAAIDVQADRQTVSLSSRSVTSAVIDSGDLVTSVWDRQQSIVLPVFLALASALVPLVLGSLQSGVSLITHRHRHAKR